MRKKTYIKKSIIWSNIALQAILPLALSFSPSIYAKDKNKDADCSCKAVNTTRDNVPKKTTNDNVIINSNSSGGILANTVYGLAKTQESGVNSNEAMKSEVTSAIVNAGQQHIQDWLSQFGTAKVQLNTDSKINLNNSSFDLLVPLYDNNKSILFTQLGTRYKDSRTTINAGMGTRFFVDNWMFGFNAFNDYDITGKNRRVSLGGEAWTDYLKISANSYFGTTNWHQSKKYEDYNEKPADGFDVIANAWLPSYPQLGGKLKYEAYKGDNVALVNNGTMQRNPKAYTVGINYTPIPLVTFGVDYKNSSGIEDWNYNAQLTWRFGESLNSQLSPQAVGLSRTLKGGRLDLVERNNDIVLNYRKNELIKLSLPDTLIGSAKSTLSLTAMIQSKHDIQSIDWKSSEFTASGGEIINSGDNRNWIVKLPTYIDGKTNSYVITGVAKDVKGNQSSSASTTVIVNTPTISTEYSNVTLQPSSLPADGKSTSILTIKLMDNNNSPISGLAGSIKLNPSFNGSGNYANRTNASLLGQMSNILIPSAHANENPIAIGDYNIGEIIEAQSGVYKSIITAGRSEGILTLTPLVNETKLKSVSLNFNSYTQSENEVDPSKSTLLATPATVIADGTSFSTIEFIARNAKDQLIDNLSDVTFDITGLSGATLSEIKSNNVKFIAKLTSSNPGVAIITAKVNGKNIKTTNVTFTPPPSASDNIDISLSTLTASPSIVVADGLSESIISFKAMNSSGQLITDLPGVEFYIQGLSSTTLSSISENNGVYTAKIKGTMTGIANIIARVSGKDIKSTTITFISSSDAEASVDSSRSSILASPSSILADGQTLSTITFTAKDSSDAFVTGLKTVSFLVTGVNGTTVSPINENNGVYTATLSGTIAGSATITAQVNGRSINSTSLNLVAMNDSLASSVDSSKSTLTAVPASIIADNSDSSLLSFVAKDVNDNLVQGLKTVSFQIAGLNGTSLSPVTESNGVYKTTLKGSLPGVAVVTAQANGRNISTIVVTLTPTAEQAQASVDSNNSALMAVPTIISSDNTTTSTLLFTAVDTQGKVVGGLGNSVTFNVSGVANTTLGQVVESSKGVYTVTLRGSNAGTATVSASVAGREIKTTTVTLNTITNQATSALMVVPSSIPADGVSNATIIYTRTDATGKPDTSNSNISFMVGGGLTGATISQVTSSNGVYMSSINGTVAGSGTITPLINGVVDSNAKSAPITISPLPASTANSSITMSKDVIMNNNTDSTTLTFIPRDDSFNALPGLRVNFTGPSYVTFSNVTENNGVYTVSMTGNNTGTALITARIGTQDIKSVNVRVSSGMAFNMSKLDSTQTVVNTSGGWGNHVSILTLQDTDGFAITGLTSTQISLTNVINDPTGEYRLVSVNESQPGKYTITVRVRKPGMIATTAGYSILVNGHVFGPVTYTVQ